MKRPSRIWRVVTVLTVCAVCGIVGLTRAWSHKANGNGATGHHLSIAPVKAWGFYHLQGETLVAYPPGQPDRNTVIDHLQIGPITDIRDHPKYLSGK